MLVRLTDMHAQALLQLRALSHRPMHAYNLPNLPDFSQATNTNPMPKTPPDAHDRANDINCIVSMP